MQPRAGQVEDILRSLHITEPGMLLRAAAIDDAAHDMLAHASASSRNRNSINDPVRRRKRGQPDGAVRTAAKDLPTRRGLDQHVAAAAPTTNAPPGRVSQRHLEHPRKDGPPDWRTIRKSR
jgi:hypothetical protein